MKLTPMPASEIKAGMLIAATVYDENANPSMQVTAFVPVISADARSIGLQGEFTHVHIKTSYARLVFVPDTILLIATPK